MTMEASPHGRWLGRVPCPVFGASVSVCATYQEFDREGPALVDFECSGEGHCGITSWDPCPLFVQCLEGRIGGIS